MLYSLVRCGLEQAPHVKRYAVIRSNKFVCVRGTQQATYTTIAVLFDVLRKKAVTANGLVFGKVRGIGPNVITTELFKFDTMKDLESFEEDHPELFI